MIRVLLFHTPMDTCKIAPSYISIWVMNTPLHCVKSVQIRSIFWSLFYCIRTEYRKIRSRKYSVFGRFSRIAFLGKLYFQKNHGSIQKPKKNVHAIISWFIELLACVPRNVSSNIFLKKSIGGGMQFLCS